MKRIIPGTGIELEVNQLEVPRLGIILRQIVIELDDEDIKHLPNPGELEIIAPVEQRVIIPVTLMLYRDFTIGYGDIDEDAVFQFGIDRNTGGFVSLTSSIYNDSTTFADALTQFLDNVTGINSFLLTQLQYADPESASGGSVGVEMNSAINAPFILSVDNAGGTDFSGGHADNIMRISVVYMLFNPETGLFE